MALLKLIFFAVVLGLVSAQEEQSSHVGSPFAITPVDYIESHFIQPGFVPGIRDCGDIGRILQMTHQGCIASDIQSVCVFNKDKPGHPEVYFISSQDVDEVLVRVKLTEGENVTKSFDVPLPATSLKAGQPYKLRCSGVDLPELLGKVFTGRMEILRKSDSSVQACMEVDMLPFTDNRKIGGQSGIVSANLLHK